MASGSTLTAPGSGVSLTPQPVAPLLTPDEVSKRKSAYDQQSSDIEKAIGETEQRTSERVAADQPNVQIPQFKEVPPPQVYNTPPEQQWGSMAMLIAGLGGLLTRGHATTALNAAANVVKGFHQHDQELTNQAFESWKIANDNMTKAMNYELQTYRSITSDAARRQGTDLREGSMELSALRADLSAAARGLGNDFMAQRLALANQREAQLEIERQQKVLDTANKAANASELKARQGQALMLVRQMPEFNDPSLTYQQKLAIEKAVGSMNASDAEDFVTNAQSELAKAKASGSTNTGGIWQSLLGKLGIGGSQSVPHPKTKEDYDKLPKGAHYVAPDGNTYVKN
jgi:hypothetical protein